MDDVAIIVFKHNLQQDLHYGLFVIQEHDVHIIKLLHVNTVAQSNINIETEEICLRPEFVKPHLL